MQLPRIGFGFILERHHKFISIRNLTYALLSLCMHMYTYIHIYLSTYVPMYIRTIYIYIYIHIHAHAFAHLPLMSLNSETLRHKLGNY